MGYVLPDLVNPLNAANDNRNNKARKKVTFADNPSSRTLSSSNKFYWPGRL